MHGRLESAIGEAKSSAIILDFRLVERAYPNGMVPLIVLVEQVRTTHGIDFSLILPDNVECQRTMRENNWAAFLAPGANHQLSRQGTNALHRFTDDAMLNELVNTQIHQALERATYAEGVLQSFEWALNEIAGNVLIHSGGESGWVQVVVQPATKHMEIVVCDGGVGIPDGIRGAFPEAGMTRDEDAIAHALKEGITSRPDFGQGKGLTGTLEIVKANVGGRLSIHSGGGLVEWIDARLAIRPSSPSFQGTMVGVQLRIDHPIDIERALWGSAPAYPFNESLFGKDMPVGLMRLELAREANGFGNRITGQKVRTKIENLLAAAPSDVLEIDFAGVGMMASSFADEVFGKLASTLGFVGFSSRLRLKGLNRFCQGIIDDVVQSRIVQSRNGRDHVK